jgi:hypothetical protein
MHCMHILKEDSLTALLRVLHAGEGIA